MGVPVCHSEGVESDIWVSRCSEVEGASVSIVVRDFRLGLSGSDFQ